MFFSVLRLLWLCARLFIHALWSPAGKELTSWLFFVVSNCEFVTFPLVSRVRCGTRYYRFLIFAPLLNLLSNCKQNITSLSLLVGTTVFQYQDIVFKQTLQAQVKSSCRILVPWVDLKCVSVACLDHAHLHFSVK